MCAQQVLEPLLKSPPPQNRFAANPPGKQHVVGSTLGLVAYAGKAFLKKGALPWDKTKQVVSLLNTWRDLKSGIKCETDDRVRPTTIQVNLVDQDSPGVEFHIDSTNSGASDIVLLFRTPLVGGGFFKESLGESCCVEGKLVCASGMRS